MKKILLRWIRWMGWMNGFDRAYFSWNRFRNAKKNRQFRKENPQVKLPPDYMLYEAYRLDYAAYYQDGADTAAALVQQWKEHGMPGHARILEWGCGPARIIRHLPALLPSADIYGTDYNSATIGWCRRNIEGVNFDTNDLNPPLRYENNSFDVVYALSVFTHLSKKNHDEWMNELHRILRPGGLLLLTTQGQAFMVKLAPEERQLFGSGALVVRDHVQEGHRSYSAFQPEKYMHALFSNRWKVVKFAAGTPQSWGPEQDTWIVQKIKE
jgi:SAM-dependent methyltransferase